MGIRRRTRRIRRWYRRHEHSAGFFAARITFLAAAAIGVAALVNLALQTV
jgi:hypothetical protein